jgi:hypothetical protein
MWLWKEVYKNTLYQGANIGRVVLQWLCNDSVCTDLSELEPVIFVTRTPHTCDSVLSANKINAHLSYVNI